MMNNMYRDPYGRAGRDIVRRERRRKELKWTKADKALTNVDFPHRVTVSQVRWTPNRFERYYLWCLEHSGRPCRMIPEVRDMMIEKDLPMPGGDPMWMVQTQSQTSRRFYFRDPGHAVAFKLILL